MKQLHYSREAYDAYDNYFDTCIELQVKPSPMVDWYWSDYLSFTPANY